MTQEGVNKLITRHNEHTIEVNTVLKIIDKIYNDFDWRTCENCNSCQRIVDNEVYCDYYVSFFKYIENGVKLGCTRFGVE